MTQAAELIGQKFGRLTVIKPGAPWRDRRRWSCRCDCGNVTLVATADLNAGKTKSCGCFKLSVMAVSNFRHGGTGTKTYNIWRDMIRRCEAEDRPAFKHYGGRGISVCRRWLDFASFLSDMGECPPGYSIERKKVNRGYTPKNCIWIPRNRQGRNRRLTIRVRGVPLADLCEQKGLRYGLVYDRIKRLGWPVQKALSRGPT